MSNIQSWLMAIRLRTLPLALASIAMGSFLASKQGAFNGMICLLCCLTTIFLQILSNLANDYGDSIHGADHTERKGPQRAVQSGKISQQAMFKAMVFMVILSVASGVSLLYISFGNEAIKLFFVFIGLGLLAIIAAITYTAGSKPYGYAGLGDISVLIFFGWVGVLGTYFLYTQTFEALLMLPATSCGLFATAVLNVNNVRDIESDKIAGKYSIPVRLGREKAVIYHWALLIIGISLSIIYTIIHYQSIYQFAFLITLPLLIKNGKAVSTLINPIDLDPYLKQMAMTTLLFVLTFGVGQLF
jgi:1,4-dihydroxy-2-naphthoate octaprenyltransferase